MDPRRVEQGLAAAHRRLLEGYAAWGGHRYFGWTEYGETRNHQGTVILSEGDCVHRFALELEREFSLQVHCQFKLNKATRVDFEHMPRQAIDIVVSDLSAFADPGSDAAAVRSVTHDAFIEVKWFPKGWLSSSWGFDGQGRIKEVQDDLDRLAEHLAKGRCRVAAMLIVQDEGFFDAYRGAVRWPPAVRPLIVGPAALAEAGLPAR
jgi:hypothetical protein